MPHIVYKPQWIPIDDGDNPVPVDTVVALKQYTQTIGYGWVDDKGVVTWIGSLQVDVAPKWDYIKIPENHDRSIPLPP
jgi:hypothetical protein